MLTWIIGPAIITLGFVGSIVATLIARRRRTERGDIGTMYQRWLRQEQVAARHAEAQHWHAS